MRYIKGIVFSNNYGGCYSNDAARASLMEMQAQSSCNTVVFVISAIQDCARESKINYKHIYMPADKDIIDLIAFAKNIGLQTILKPEIICMDGGTQEEIARCHHQESEDSYWFQEYTQYIMHYAQIANKSDCDMFIIGCELVELEQKETYWRNLICKVRKVYSGFLTYNANRLKESNVMWWDALDYISANGFYKNSELSGQIVRIDEIQKKYNKPFFFSEVGCKSCEGSAENPGDWTHQGKVDFEEQVQYFDTFLNIVAESKNLSGMVVYHWLSSDRDKVMYQSDDSYNISGKPVCEVIRQVWKNGEDSISS